MGSTLSYMQLLAAVGDKAPCGDVRIPSAPSPDADNAFQSQHTEGFCSSSQVYERGSPSRRCTYGSNESEDIDERELGSASRRGTYANNESEESDGRELEYSSTDTEEDDEVEIDFTNQVLQSEDGDLYDYEFPIPDCERVEIEIPAVQFVQVESQAEQPPWKKRKRHTKGVFLPQCRKSTGIGAVETAMRRSSNRTTTYIFEPAVGMTFDSVAEAHSFFNLYSWEKGFGIRYGKSHTNKVNSYRSMQEIECGNAGRDSRVQNNSRRCGCKAMIRLHRTDDHGWFISRYDPGIFP